MIRGIIRGSKALGEFFGCHPNSIQSKDFREKHRLPVRKGVDGELFCFEDEAMERLQKCPVLTK